MEDQAHRCLIATAMRSCQKAYELVRTNGPVELADRTDADLFEFLARVVSGQQLTRNAAEAIFRRVNAASDSAGGTLFEFVSYKNRYALTDCGLSRNKAKALLALKAAYASGSLLLDGDVTPTHAEIIEKVTSVWGLGRWSADMTAIFYYGLPDVWSEADGALRNGIEILTGRSWRESLALVSLFSPYRSYLALHVWKGLDDGFLGVGRETIG